MDADSEEPEVEVPSTLPRSRKLEVAVSWLRNLASDVSSGCSLINKKSSLLQE